MSEQTVGIRQLKEQLSLYVEQVKAGATVVITERGKPVGRMVPVAPSLERQMERLAEAHLLAWSGRRLGPASPVVPVRTETTLADLLLDDRQ